MEVEIILLTPTMCPIWKMQMKCHISLEIKKYTNKRKCASLCKRTLYGLQSTTAEK